MQKFSMTCSCGDTMTVEADSREEAVSKMKGMWDEAAVTKHMTEKHPGEPMISVADAHAQIDQKLVAA